MADSMATFEDITRDESLKTKPILLFLNKVDKFMEKLADIPISDYFSDYNGGASYAKACEYFAQQFKSLDRRKDGLLHLYLTNVANTESFMGTLRCLRSTVLKENLMISVF